MTMTLCLAHGEDHLAEVFGLVVLFFIEGYAAEFRQAVYKAGYLSTEKLFDLLYRGVGVLDGVVQEARGHALGVELEIRKDIGYFDGVRVVRLPGLADLP
jgi:hypothetical protein